VSDGSDVFDFPRERLDLRVLLDIVFQHIWVIAAAAVLFGAAGGIFSFVATPIYESEAVLLPSSLSENSKMPNGLSGVASLAGITLGASSDGTEALATLRSRILIEEFIIDEDLMPILFADEWSSKENKWLSEDPSDWPGITSGVDYFIDNVRSVIEDSSSGLITIRIRWNDATSAAEWITKLVERTNERLRTHDLENSKRKLAYLNEQLSNADLVELRQAISRLIETEMQSITLAHAEIEYAFKMIDPPRVAKEPIFPRPILYIVLAMLLGVIIGVLMALVRHSWGVRS
jgi:uncharacterized protein involved in exopolysaccharide biosynthesis